MNSMGLSKKVLGVPAVMKSSLLRIHGVGEQCFAPLHSGLKKTLCNPMVRVHTYTIKDPLETSKTRTPRVVNRHPLRIEQNTQYVGCWCRDKHPRSYRPAVGANRSSNLDLVRRSTSLR